MKIYYTIWVDCILQLRKQPSNKYSWKWKSMIMISIAMALNLMLLLTVFGKFFTFLKYYIIEIDIFPGYNLDALLGFFILFGFPISIFNYFFVFHKKKYEKVTKKYKFYNGRYFLTYFLISIGTPLVCLITLFLIQNNTK